MNRTIRIVVIEDSETQAFRLSAQLREQGWEVSIACTAEAALAALGDLSPICLSSTTTFQECAEMNSAGEFE